MSQRGVCAVLGADRTLERFVNEFTFRASNRERLNGLFDILVGVL